MLVYTYGSGGWLPPAKPPVDQVSDCHTVMVPSFLPAILILPKALGRLPAICCSVARSRKILTGLPPAFWESRGAGGVWRVFGCWGRRGRNFWPAFPPPWGGGGAPAPPPARGLILRRSPPP